MVIDKDCIFCRIISGEIPADKVYEDKDILAFLDISPANKGHTLVVPKKHYETILDVPKDLLCNIMIAVRKISKAIIDSLDVPAFYVRINNFKEAGQVVPHLHVHIIPRFSGDGLQQWPTKKYENGETKEIAEKIRGHLKTAGF